MLIFAHVDWDFILIIIFLQLFITCFMTNNFYTYMYLDEVPKLGYIYPWVVIL